MEATPKIAFLSRVRIMIKPYKTMFFMGSEFSAKPKWLFSHGTDAAMAVAAEAPFPMAATKQRW